MELMIKDGLRNFSTEPVSMEFSAPSSFFEGHIILKEISKGQLLSQHLLQYTLNDCKVTPNLKNLSLAAYGWQVFGIQQILLNSFKERGLNRMLLPVALCKSVRLEWKLGTKISKDFVEILGY